MIGPQWPKRWPRYHVRRDLSRVDVDDKQSSYRVRSGAVVTAASCSSCSKATCDLGTFDYHADQCFFHTNRPVYNEIFMACDSVSTGGGSECRIWAD